MTEPIESAKHALERLSASCVLVNNGVRRVSTLGGVRPVLEWIINEREILNGASVADKVVGRAAALLMIYAGVKEVYAGILSEGAGQLFEAYGVEYAYAHFVPNIMNRNNDDICPMEKLCSETDSPDVAFNRIKTFITKTGG